MASFNDVVNDVISFTRKIGITFFESMLLPGRFRENVKNGHNDRYIAPSLYFFIGLFIHFSFVLCIVFIDPYVWTNTDSFFGTISYYLFQTSIVNRILYTLPAFCILYVGFLFVNRLIWKKPEYQFYQTALRYWVSTSLIIINLSVLGILFITHELLEAIFTYYNFDPSKIVNIIDYAMYVLQILSFFVPFFALTGFAKLHRIRRILFCLLIGFSFQISKMIVKAEIKIINRFDSLQRVEILSNELSKEDFALDISYDTGSIVKINFSFIVKNNSKTNILYSRDSAVDIYIDNIKQQGLSIIKSDETEDSLYYDFTLKISDSSHRLTDHFDMIKGEEIAKANAEILLDAKKVDTFKLLLASGVKYRLLYTYIVGGVEYYCDKNITIKYRERFPSKTNITVIPQSTVTLKHKIIESSNKKPVSLESS